MEHNNNSINNSQSAVRDNLHSSQLSEAEIAELNEIWKPVNTSTTPEMLSMNTSGSKDFDRFVKNIRLEGI